MYQLYPKRWIILLAFAIVNCTNNWIWITWGPITPEMAVYWNLPDGYVDNLSAIYMYFFVVFVFAIMYLWVEHLKFSKGLRLAAGAQVVGSLMRWLGMNSFATVLVGTLLCAITMSFVVTTAPFLAAKWFGDHERTTATAIGVLANQFGGVLGLGSTIFINFTNNTDGTINPHRVSMYLLSQFITSIVGFLLLMVFLTTDEPPTPPNAGEAARLQTLQQQEVLPVTEKTSLQQKETNTTEQEEEEEDKNPSFWESIKLIFKHGIFYVAVYACAVGAFYAIPTFISQFVTSDWTPSEIGWLGVLFQFTGVVGSFITGRVVDRFQRRGTVSRVLALGAVLFFGGFWIWRESSNHILVFAIMMGSGFCMASSSTLGFDLAAAMTYPANEATVGSLLQFGAGTMSLLLVNIGSWISAGTVFVSVVWAVLAAGILILLVISTKTRRPVHE